MARKKRLDVDEVLDRERAGCGLQEEQNIYQTAGYIRLSIEDSGKTDGYSLENQEKLVRDYIPDIIREKGQTPVIRTLDDEEFIQCLEKKLREEVEEFLEEKNLDELGDILEVLEELAHLQGWTDGEIRHTREEKAQTTGLFRERVFLEKVIEE